MRLLTHNQLVCVRKGCDNAFPLQIVFNQVEQEDTEPNPEMVLHLLPRVDYAVLLNCARALGIEDLPEELPAITDVNENRDLLERLHTVLFDVHVTRGQLICPVCERPYDIQAGIPNMRIDETEL